MLKPTKEWLKEYEEIKSKLKPLNDLNDYFTKKEIAGIKIDQLYIGDIEIPTGKIMAYDPLIYYDKTYSTYIQEVPTGNFPVTLSIAIIKDWGDKYAAVKVEFNNKKPIRYEQGLTGDENFKGFEKGDFFGFAVDTGLATILDSKTNDEYCDFIEKWYKQTDGEIYDDLFASLLEDSYNKNPKYQREGGDWLMWEIPETNLKVPIFASGFGDGVYPVYFGYDHDNDVCNIIIHFIDIIEEFKEE
ncbi:DUF4241 domain-containing protein [Methanobrevibacter filiformis]|uniref:DUF4241 domain-containing protein n=1 Tax=Methanobrevibacter filiformis TaxID=55758 RepID=A0A165Z9X8_9EURY|nr:DUF4241 domain-containing protein [Methanobrevibacter filiformis]KZX10452.1 hypothetical protein MBFIL_17510 [Methanobrevibacter filiformis]